MDKYVLFKQDGSVRISYEKPQSGTYLVNPKVPRGVPPHEWKLLDGQIITSFPSSNSKPKKSFWKALKKLITRS